LIWDLRFAAMGARAHLLVEGDPELLAPAARQVERLERLWSRSIEDSDVSRLNRAGGAAKLKDERGEEPTVPPDLLRAPPRRAPRG
jgi:hypothetical protein